MADWLLATGFVPADLLDGQFAARRDDILRDLPDALQREHKTYDDASGPYVVAQLEFWGAAEVLERHRGELAHHLLALGARTMLNMVDLQSGSSWLYVPDDSFRSYVASKLTLSFSGDTAFSEQAVLRKQIVAEIAGVGW
jgi:hypothetical protein